MRLAADFGALLVGFRVAGVGGLAATATAAAAAAAAAATVRRWLRRTGCVLARVRIRTALARHMTRRFRWFRASLFTQMDGSKCFSF